MTLHWLRMATPVADHEANAALPPCIDTWFSARIEMHKVVDVRQDVLLHRHCAGRFRAAARRAPCPTGGRPAFRRKRRSGVRFSLSHLRLLSARAHAHLRGHPSRHALAKPARARLPTSSRDEPGPLHNHPNISSRMMFSPRWSSASSSLSSFQPRAQQQPCDLPYRAVGFDGATAQPVQPPVANTIARLHGFDAEEHGFVVLPICPPSP